MATDVDKRVSYRDLHQNPEAAFKGAQEGLRACKATLVLLQQTATLEENFGTALVKVGEGFASFHEENGPSINKAIASICSAIQGLGRQHCSLATSISQDVCRGMTTFTEQQGEQVKRMMHEVHGLMEDMAKERAAHRKARERYRKACRDAEGVIRIAVMRGGGSADALPALQEDKDSQPLPQGLQKIDALWKQVWDQLNVSGSGVGGRPLKDRATDARATLDEAQRDYDASRSSIEAKEVEYRKAMQARLSHFQSIEESRSQLLKTQLQRLQAHRKAAWEKVGRVVSVLREAAEQVDPSADLAVYCAHMAKLPSDDVTGSPDGVGVDATIESATGPSLSHIDRCVRNLRGLCHSFSELAAAEEHYAKGLVKLAEKSGYPEVGGGSAIVGAASSGFLAKPPHNGRLVGHGRSTFRKYVGREGQSMRATWEGYMRSNHAIARLHLTTASRVAESVCVILAQTQDELSGTKVEVGVAQTAALRTFSATRAGFVRARDRAESRSRDLHEREQELSRSTGALPAPTNAASLQLQAADALGGSRSRLETRVHSLREEVQSSELALEQASAALRDEKASLATEVEIILRALGEREENRLTRMKMALTEVFHAQSIAHLGTGEEEDRRSAAVEGVDVAGDLDNFVTTALAAATATVSAAHAPVSLAREATGEPAYSTLLLDRLSLLLILLKEEEEAGGPQPTSALQGRYADLAGGLMIGRMAAQVGSSLDQSASGASDTAAVAGGLEREASLTTSSARAARRASLDGSVGSVDLSMLYEDEEEGEGQEKRAGVVEGEVEGGVGASPARAVIQDRVANAQALATTRLPESMSPRPFRCGSQGGEAGGPAAVFEAVLDGLLNQNHNSNGRASPDPTNSEQGQGERERAEGRIGIGMGRPPRQEHHDKHALLFPPDQTLASSLFRGIDLNRTLENNNNGSGSNSNLQALPLVPEEDGSAPPSPQKPEPRKPEPRSPESPGQTEVRVGSPFRPITPQPHDPSTAAVRPTPTPAIGTSASGSGGGGKKPPTTPVCTTPEPPGLSREGRSNSLSSSLSSSFTRSLSLSVPRPGTPKDQAKGMGPPAGEGVTAAPGGEPPADDASQEEIRIFNLPPSERVVESYSCALLPNNLLIHGRLFVTPRFVCFGSWGTTRLVLPMESIDFVERANTMGFVPNALWVVMRAGDRYFFSSFLYRDMCFELLQKLLPRSIIELKTLPAKLLGKKLEEMEKQSDAASADEQGADPKQSGVVGATAAGVNNTVPVVVRRVSFNDDAAAAVLPVDVDASALSLSPGKSTADRSPTPAPLPLQLPPVTVAPAPIPPVVMQEDAVIRRMTVVTAETLETDPDSFFAELWADASPFYIEYLRERGDKDIDMGVWVDKDEMDAYSGESFSKVREVRYHRNRQGESVGPRMVLTRECQMYRVDHKGDRATLTTLLSFTGIPYCDYFIVQTRWVVTRVVVHNENRCMLQIGLDVVFRQNLLLKAAIRGGTEGEMRRMLQSYLGKAKTRLSAAALLPPILTPTTIASEPVTSASSSPTPMMGPTPPTAAATVGENGPGSASLPQSLAPSPPPSTVRHGHSSSSMPLALAAKAEAGGPSIVEATVSMASHAARSLFNLLLPNGVGMRDVVVIILALALLINMRRLGRTTHRLAEVGGRLEAVMKEQEDMVRLVRELQERLAQTAAECMGP